jgi:hypothetical protein
MDVLAELKASGLEADIGMMSEHFGVSELDFVNQVIDDVREGYSATGGEALQRLSSRIDSFKNEKRPKLTLVPA